MLKVDVPDNRPGDFSDFFENAPIGVVILAPRGVVRYANRAQREMTPLASTVGTHLAELLADDTSAAMILEAGEQGNPVKNLRVRVASPDGEPLVVLNAASWRDPECGDREIYCFMFPDANQSEVRRSMPTEEEAKSTIQPGEHAMLIRAFEHAPVGLHIVGGDGIIKWANHYEVDRLGYLDDPSGYIGHHIAEFHADQAVIDDMLDRLVSGRPLTHHPATLLTRFGERVPVVIYSSPRFEGDDFINTRCYTFEATGLERATRSFTWPRNDEDTSSSAGELTTVLQRLAGRREAEESLGFIAEAGMALATADGLSTLGSLVVPHFADMFVIERIKADGAAAEIESTGAAVDELGAENTLRIPFRSGRVEGTVVFGRGEARRPFGAGDIALAGELARRVACMMELVELRKLVGNERVER